MTITRSRDYWLQLADFIQAELMAIHRGDVPSDKYELWRDRVDRWLTVLRLPRLDLDDPGYVARLDQDIAALKERIRRLTPEERQ